MIGRARLAAEGWRPLQAWGPGRGLPGARGGCRQGRETRTVQLLSTVPESEGFQAGKRSPARLRGRGIESWGEGLCLLLLSANPQGPSQPTDVSQRVSVDHLLCAKLSLSGVTSPSRHGRWHLRRADSEGWRETVPALQSAPPRERATGSSCRWGSAGEASWCGSRAGPRESWVGRSPGLREEGRRQQDTVACVDSARRPTPCVTSSCPQPPRGERSSAD